MYFRVAFEKKKILKPSVKQRRTKNFFFKFFPSRRIDSNTQIQFCLNLSCFFRTNLKFFRPKNFILMAKNNYFFKKYTVRKKFNKKYSTKKELLLNKRLEFRKKKKSK